MPRWQWISFFVSVDLSLAMPMKAGCSARCPSPTLWLLTLIRLYPLILAGLLLGSIVYLAKGLAAHQSPFTSNLLVVIFLETFLVPNPLTLGEGWTEFPPLDPPAWSLCFEFLANFAYAAFITRLTKKAMTYLLILSAIVVFGQAYVLGEVGGGNHWHNLAGGLGRVFFPFLCGLFLSRRWRKRPAGESQQIRSTGPHRASRRPPLPGPVVAQLAL